MLNRPASLVTTVRVCSISAGLEASTVTPGSNAPLAPVTVPEIVCAETERGRSSTTASNTACEHSERIIDTPPFKPRKVAQASEGLEGCPALWDEAWISGTEPVSQGRLCTGIQLAQLP